MKTSFNSCPLISRCLLVKRDSWSIRILFILLLMFPHSRKLSDATDGLIHIQGAHHNIAVIKQVTMFFYYHKNIENKYLYIMEDKNENKKPRNIEYWMCTPKSVTFAYRQLLYQTGSMWPYPKMRHLLTKYERGIKHTNLICYQKEEDNVSIRDCVNELHSQCWTM